MSLLDALLLDPPRIDVWLALRNDGVVGTGTQNDPWSVNPVLDVAKTINTSLNASGTEATATFSSAHGYSNNDIVAVTGAADPAFNGIFVIYGVSATAFKYQMDSTPAAPGGTAAIAQKALELRFDTVMRTLVGPNTCVHIGPGLIPTRGFYEGIGASVSWQLQAGLRIVGSGMDVTKIKLMATAAGSTRCYAFGHELIAGGKPNLMDFTEISELTVHCGFTSASRTSTEANGGVRMMGNHARVVRVKITNWGCRNASLTCFGIGLLTANTNTGNVATDVGGVINCGIQECIVVEPQSVGAVTGPMTLLHIGGKETATGADPRGYGLTPYLRNCFVDCGQTTLANNAADKVFRALGISWCRGGMIEGNQVQNVFYGGPFSDGLGAYEIIVRNNHFRNVATGPIWLLSTTSANGIQKLLIEGNVVELTTVDVNPIPSVATRYALGVLIYDNATGFVPFGGVVIKGNTIRYLDGAAPTTQKGSGVLVFGASSLLVRETILDLVKKPYASPLDMLTNLSNKGCTSVQYFENRNPDGSLVQGYREDTSGPGLYTELATDADDAFILSLLLRS